MINDESDLSIYDFNSIINYVKNNYIQILLLFLVFCIIYIVDYISNINAMLMTPISILPGASQPPVTKMPKGRKTSKR